VLPSLNVPVAVNCCVAFFVSVAFAGVTAIDFRVAAATASVMDPVTAADVAVMSLLPAAFAVANPPALMVATLRFCELHVTLEVMSCDDPSVKCPVAANCCVPPIAIVALAGETPMDVNCG
jgi:hypothetical protein